MSEMKATLFDNKDLVPPSWLESIAGESNQRFRIFNPSIAATGDGYAMCYRVVRDGSDLRWLATCSLNADFSIVPGSVTPFSDHISFARPQDLNERAKIWHADPRYLRLRGRLYLLWNDGGNRPTNNQFLAEMRPDGLLPISSARAVSTEPRRPIEKNWMFFDADDGVHAIYSIAPHTVLNFDLNQIGRLDGRVASQAGWATDYESFFGVLRGSAQPVRLGDSYLTLAHSSFKTPNGRIYCACFYRFSASGTFKVLEASPQPFELPNPLGGNFGMTKLNAEVAEVVYPCGIVHRGDDLVISYGINDEVCAITTVKLADVEAALEPVAESFSVRSRGLAIKPHVIDPASDYTPRPKPDPIPLMWWDTAGKKLDGAVGDRKFKIGNFGDIASKDVVEAVTGNPTRPVTGGTRKLIGIGSVIHTASNQDIVWGSGMKGTKMMLNDSVKELSVHAVRGPLTLDMVRRHGIDISKVTQLFDPGCLIPTLYPEATAKARETARKTPFRIIPHYRDDMLLRRKYYMYNRHFISVDCTPVQMIKAIVGAERVISSSLHGIIFAEALGVPAMWLAPIGGEDELKYYDYYFGTGRFAVKRFASIEDALRAEPMELPKFDLQAYIDTFPQDEVTALAATGLRAGANVKFATFDKERLARMFSFWNFDRAGAEGQWGTAPFSRFSTTILAERDAHLEAVLEIRPFNHVDFRTPQGMAVSVNEGPVTEVDWGRGATDPVTIRLPIRATGMATPVEFVFRARNSRTPKSMGIMTIEEPITFCLMSLRIVDATAELDFSGPAAVAVADLAEGAATEEDVATTAAEEIDDIDPDTAEASPKRAAAEADVEDDMEAQILGTAPEAPEVVAEEAVATEGA